METGTTTITGCTINNSASITGGGVTNNGTLIINSSTISGNTATAANGGGVYTNSSLTTDSDIISEYNFAFDSNNGGTINLSGYHAFAANFLHSITS